MLIRIFRRLFFANTRRLHRVLKAEDTQNKSRTLHLNLFRGIFHVYTRRVPCANAPPPPGRQL